VSQEEVRTLARYSTFAHLNASDDPIVVAAEEHAERLILLLDGRVRVYEEGFSGRQVTVSVVEGGTLVGATGFAFCSPLGLRVEALESSTICGVRRRVFEQLVDKNPTLGTRVARLFGERLIETQARLADLACKEVPERLASQILRLVESEGVVTREGYTILTRYTHQQLGSMIGANREAVTRALKELREQGGVDVRNRRIHVVNAEILRHTSE
jgi:CRP-like cAMP-binding protein